MNIIDDIKDYISLTYTNKSKDIISKFPLKYLNKLLSMYTNQNENIFNEYIIFTMVDGNIEITNNYSTISDKNTYQVIYFDTNEKNYIFQAFAFQQIYELIIINSNKYIFIPIMFSYKDSKIGHATMLVIDRINKIIRFFDPNGLSRGNINYTIIDKFMKTYFDIFNITFDENYNYVDQKEWMNIRNDNDYKNYILNSSLLKNENINSGHCMIFILLISHILSKENHELSEIITEIKKIKHCELLDIIMGYTERTIENFNLIK